MSTEFKREYRYIVFKLSDVERYLTDADRAHLAMMKNEIDAGRDCANKPPFKGLIVESDWPEYEPTWKAIEARVTGAQPAPSVPDGWKLVPIEPTPGMIDAAEYVDWGDADVRGSCINAWNQMLSVAPEAKPSVPDGWKEAAIAWEVCGSLHREYAKSKDPFFKKRQEDFVKHANDARAMIAAAPEAKP